MELVQNENGKITSLALLEQINFFRRKESSKKDLEHKDLLKIIRHEFDEEIHEGKISPMFYTLTIGNGASRKSPFFELTSSQAKQVLVRESKFVRRAVIKIIETMETFPAMTESQKNKCENFLEKRVSSITETEKKVSLHLSNLKMLYTEIELYSKDKLEEIKSSGIPTDKITTYKSCGKRIINRSLVEKE